jgi:hypothetical protein
LRSVNSHERLFGPLKHEFWSLRMAPMMSSREISLSGCVGTSVTGDSSGSG